MKRLSDRIILWIVLILMLFVFVGLAYIIHYRYTECKAFGHTSLYCALK